MRRIAAIIVVLQLLAGASLQPLEACSVPARPSPELSTIATPDADYVLALVEPIERFRQFQPNDAEQRILARYPVSGVYRTGVTPELLWRIDDWYDPPEVNSFFSNADGVHWVLSDPWGLRFYRNGELMREVNLSELLSAPWRAGEVYCGGPKHLNVKGDSLGRRPEVAVTTEEGGRLVFAAAGGDLLSEQRPSALASVVPTVEEEQLAGLVSDLSALAKSAQFGSLAYEWERRFEAASLHDCRPESTDFAKIAQNADQQIEPDSYRAIWLTPWRAEVPVDVDVLGLARIRLPEGTPFALYRVPEGEAPRTLCGMDPLPTRLLAEELSSRFQDRRDDFGDLAAALNGPTVLTAIAGIWEEHEEKDLIGLANVWRYVDGEWHVVGHQLFSLAPPVEAEK